MALFSSKEKETVESCVGVDIGSYAIKVLQVKKDASQIHLETYGELELAAYDALPPGSISNIGEEKTITALKDLFLASKITAQKFVFAIPMSECFITAINIPRVSDKELAALLPIEARKYLPMPVSEVKLNYWRSDLGDKVTDTKDTIMLAAVKNSTFEQYERYAKKLGLKDYSLEIESLSQGRMVLHSYPKEEILLAVDIGGKSSFISLIKDGSIQETKIIQKGSYDNTFQISKVLGLSIDVAEEAKRVFGYFGDDSSPHLAEVMGLASFPLFDEIRSHLLRYERKYSIIIQKVILTGGGALQNGIQKILSEFLEKEIILLDVFSELALPENLREALKEDNQKYAIAAGLALKNYFK